MPPRRVVHKKFGAARASGAGKITQIGTLRTEKMYFDLQASQLAESSQVQKFCNVPLQCVTHYVERASLESLLRARLDMGFAQKLSRSTIVVVHGLAGAGKTQLVLRYIQETQNEYDGIFWVQLGGKHTVEEELMPIYRWMYAREISGPQAVAPTLKEMVLNIKSWFKSHAGKWLWVMDSADNLDDPSDETYVNLTEIIPQEPCVRAVVTTRNGAARDISSSAPIEVDKMDEPQACELFWKSSKIDPASASRKDRKTCGSLVKELGYLALAVSLAGATISESPRMSKDPSLYLLEYRKNRKRLLQKQPGWIGTQYSNSILASWELSYSYVQRKSPLAANLLGFLALLDSKDLYLHMFEIALQVIQTRGEAAVPYSHKLWRNALLPGGDEKLLDTGMIEEAFSVLCSFSLAQYDKKLDAYFMHELVHAWGFERLDDDQQMSIGPAVCGFIEIGLIDQKRNPKSLARLTQHVMPCFTTVSTTIGKNCRNKFFELQFLDQCQRFMHSEYSLGLWKNASIISRYIVDQSTRLQGRHHQDTVNSMTEWSDCLLRENDTEQSARVIREVIAIRERDLGMEHPATLVARANLAVTMTEEHKLDEASSIVEKSLTSLRQNLGDDHPNTFSAMGIFACILLRKGQYDEAESMMRTVQEKTKQLWGESDPMTIEATENLSHILFGQERWEEAAEIVSNTIETRLEIMGEDHPYLHESLHNLAYCKAHQGKLDEAKAVLERIPKHGMQALTHKNDGSLSMTPELITQLQEYLEFGKKLTI